MKMHPFVGIVAWYRHKSFMHWIDNINTFSQGKTEQLLYIRENQKGAVCCEEE